MTPAPEWLGWFMFIGIAVLLICSLVMVVSGVAAIVYLGWKLIRRSER